MKNIKDFPPFLFVRGKRIDIKNSIGIVGTRKCSNEGINACKKIIKELSEYEDITIISGLANGIDSIALEESLKYNINTIAVIPTNIYDCYPIENENLKKYIEENGTVITEIRPEQNLQKLNFVMRNRIIAGLSRCIFIPESYKKGGSLITAKFAQLYDRDVFCTPSSIFNASFEGCNDLIKYNNAKLITSADDIASEFGWRKKVKKYLVIVESPSKAKTIEKILGKDFEVVASFGHIIDLPKSKMGVDIENNFEPQYITIKGKAEILKNLKTKSKKASIVYLASDLDREGEAISWHISNYIKMPEKFKRIVFNEITSNAIKNAIKSPRDIDINLVKAQQTRRILDRLVGYIITPLLWKSIDKNATAGRVQSVSLKIVCDLEDEIKAFVPREYREVSILLENGVELKLNKIKEEKIDKIFDENIKIDISDYVKITNVEKKLKTQRPPLVFKTSTLQQAASSYLGFSASKTMRIAQQLYEGLDIAGVTKGLITYMRTDSTRVSDEAKRNAKEYIIENIGKDYVGNYISKDKNSQDAHEGIRPTYMDLEPSRISTYLSKDQNNLYSLIWKRFITSQLAPVKYEQLQINAVDNDYEFTGTINKIVFDGYYKYQKSEDDIKTKEFPDIKIGEEYKVDNVDIKNGVTKAPTRYTEATLVKKLEAEGIGRPSTYASILDALVSKEYVNIEDKKLVPTLLGYTIKNELEQHFAKIMNIKFTAKMEDNLDEIAEGNKDYISILKEYYESLQKASDEYSKQLIDLKEIRIVSDVLDSKGCAMILKSGRFGKYLISETEENEKISLKGIDISKEEIATLKVSLKDKIEKLQEQKKVIKQIMYRIMLGSILNLVDLAFI